MPKKPLPPKDTLLTEYRGLFSSMVLRSQWRDEVTRTVRRIAESRQKYEEVAKALGGRIPWEWIGAIHNMESTGNFSTHLHNGDTLRRRTTHVPAGRPTAGNPPFTWEESAIDALTMKGLEKVGAWSVAEMLYQAERYNGWGYREWHPSVLSPYLWSGTKHYERGKYVEDGKWDGSFVSEQLGVAPILGAFFSMKGER